MSAWMKCSLGDVLTLKRGYDLPTAERKPGIYPIISSGGISGYHSSYMVEGPGVITGRYGTIGDVFFIKGKFWPLNTSLYVRDFKGNDPKFICYFLRTLDLGSQNVAGAVPGLNRNSLHKMQVVVPRTDIQRKIAAILSSYDDLIENNKRRITLLEKMAEELYREWFVRFRFPEYRNVKVVKGVPEGWELVKVNNAFDFMGGGTPTKNIHRYWHDGDVNWFTPSDITASKGIFQAESADQCTEEGVSSSSAKMFPAYSVMMTSRATIGAIGINLSPACTNQGFITCIPNARYPLTFLYHWLKLSKPYFELLSGGATFAELTKGTFRKIEILTPPQHVVEEFDKFVSPLFSMIENLSLANVTLISSRDALLPRLISGKLSVEDLDIRVPPSMRDHEFHPNEEITRRETTSEGVSA